MFRGNIGLAAGTVVVIGGKGSAVAYSGGGLVVMVVVGISDG